MNYQLLGEQMATTAKEMLKLNSKLDNVLDKLMEVEALDSLKKDIKSLIDRDQWEEAKTKVIEAAKLNDKKEKLVIEDKQLRASLEELRIKMQNVAEGKVGSPDTAAPTVELSAVG